MKNISKQERSKLQQTCSITERFVKLKGVKVQPTCDVNSQTKTKLSGKIDTLQFAAVISLDETTI